MPTHTKTVFLGILSLVGLLALPPLAAGAPGRGASDQRAAPRFLLASAYSSPQDFLHQLFN